MLAARWTRTARTAQKIRKARRPAAAGIVGLALAAALVGAACGEGDTTVIVNEAQQSGISVSGAGAVTITPDIAVLNLGVEVTRPTVAEAREQAAVANAAIRGSLESNGVAEKDIATQFFNIRPQMIFRREETPEITGFTVSNQLRIAVREIDDVSKVLDDAVEAGGDAVRVNGISFEVDEPERFLGEARQEAMADARQRAEQLAQLAGVALGKVRSISESGGFPPPVFQRAAIGGDFALAEAATPISPGETEITLTVHVVYEVD